MSRRLAKRVLLVTWPGAEWKSVSALLDSGAMPNTQRLVESGVLALTPALAPQIGPSLYTSMVTGVRADRHGILTSAECDLRTGLARPPLSTSRRRKALWNILGDCGLRSLVVGWLAQYPVEPVEGVSVSAELFDAVASPGFQWTAPPDSVFPIHLAARLAALCVHPTELAATDLLPFLPNLASIDQKQDSRVRVLATRLARIISAHAVATSLMQSEPWDFLAVQYGLIESALLEMNPNHVPHDSRVVEAAYRFSDMMLGRLIELSGPDSLVILASASGVYRAPGFFCTAGAGLKIDELMHGATLLDIAPTVLFALGCPVARDFDGMPLTSAFLHPPVPEFAPAWQSTPASDHENDHAGPRKWIDELERLGYRDSCADRIAQTCARFTRERALNLATVYIGAGRFPEAAVVLEELRAQHGGDETCLLALAYVYLLARHYEKCRDVLPAIAESERTNSILATIRAFLAAVDGKRNDALSLLAAARTGAPQFPLLSYSIGCLYLSLGKCEKAEAAFRSAAHLDPSYWPAQQGRAAALRRLGRLREAADAVRASLSLNFSVPESHSLLGVTLLALGDHARAVDAFRTARALSGAKAH